MKSIVCNRKIKGGIDENIQRRTNKYTRMNVSKQSSDDDNDDDDDDELLFTCVLVGVCVLLLQRVCY